MSISVYIFNVLTKYVIHVLLRFLVIKNESVMQMKNVS